MKRTKVLVFDMDGTIADLYGVDNWLGKLRNSDASPYKDAQPLYDMMMLTECLEALKEIGWTIAITSWLSKESTKEYDREVRKAKKEWLEKYNFPYDEIHLVKYGTTKAECTREKKGTQILFDDNAKVRQGWTLGPTVDASKENLLEVLTALLNLE